MNELALFFIILFAGILFSSLFNRLNLPWVLAIIVAGVVVGPYGFNVFQNTPTVEFFGQVGLVFLMFMAGLEIKFSGFSGYRKDISVLTALNAGFPFVIGLGVGWLFGYGWQSMLLIGIIFISSSIAVIVPSLQAHKLIKTRTGSTILSSTIIQDILSLVLLSVVLQASDQITPLPLPAFYTILFVLLLGLRLLISRLHRMLTSPQLKSNKLMRGLKKFFDMRGRNMDDHFQRELRFVFIALLAVVILFEFLGLHPIIAGFFAGLIFAEFITSDLLKAKLNVISYGLFIPVFFIIIGAQADISIITKTGGALSLIIVIVLASMGAKFISGFIAGKLRKRRTQDALYMGAATMPQLSTTLATAFAGLELGIIDERLITAFVILSIITTLTSSLLTRYLAGRVSVAK